MRDVLTLPTARTADPGHKSHPVPPTPVTTLVASIDRALGDKWSFDIVHHEVVGDETIVFIRLTVDGRSRVGVGGTSEKGTLVHRLNAAAVDALMRGAEWMGAAIIAASAAQPPAEPVLAGPDATSRITRKQLDYALSLARDRGIPRDKLVARCLADFKKKPEYLTRTEASELIESLRKEAA